MLTQQRHQAQALGAQLPAHERLALRGGVAAVEQKVDRVQERGQPPGELAPFGDFEGGFELAEASLGAHQALRHRFGGGQIRARDLARIEATHGLQREHGLLGGTQGRMTGHEHESQRVIGFARVLGVGEAEPPGGRFIRRIERIETRLAADAIERLVARRDRKPRRRLLGRTFEGPLRERRAKGVLHGVLDQREPRRPEQTRQPGADVAGFAPEQSFQLGFCCGHARASYSSCTWRTSM